MLTCTPCGDVGFGNLEVLALEVTHHILSDGSEVLDYVGKGLGRAEGPHLKRLLSKLLFVLRRYLLLSPC